MIARLRSLWFSINASYWFFPALFAILGLAASLVFVHIDRNGAAQWLSSVEAINPARPQSASNMLTVLAGSTIGVASTVFSITIAAVAYASGNYGPRLLDNFMEDKGNQLSLATFIGTFVYALSVLRTVRAENEAPASVKDAVAQSLPGFVPQLSLLVAYGLMIVSVGVLVYFLHHIPSSIRINTVIEGIADRLLRLIDENYPDGDLRNVRERALPEGCAVLANHTGFIRFIELGELRRLGEKHGCTVGLAVRAGDFVHPGVVLARLSADTAESKLAEKVRDCFSLGASRTSEQDLEFSIDELVEIALRALSPGINDPFTAITAIQWLGAATAKLGTRDLRIRVGGEDPETCTLVPLADGFGHFLARGFGAARSGVASSRLATLVALDTLGNAAQAIFDDERRALLLREGVLLLAQAESALHGPDLDEVRTRHRQFAAAFGG